MLVGDLKAGAQSVQIEAQVEDVPHIPEDAAHLEQQAGGDISAEAEEHNDQNAPVAGQAVEDQEVQDAIPQANANSDEVPPLAISPNPVEDAGLDPLHLQFAMHMGDEGFVNIAQNQVVILHGGVNGTISVETIQGSHFA